MRTPMSENSEIQVLRRRISPAQQRKRREIVDTTLGLIAAGRSEVSMESVAAAAGVSRTTLYRYYTSREHLLAEVTLAAGRNLIAHLRNNPPGGRTIGDRIESLCRRFTTIAGASEKVLASCIGNLSSSDPAVFDTYEEIENIISGVLGSVLGNLEPANGAILQTVLFRYLLGAFMLATTGKLGFDEVEAELISVCRLLMPDVWEHEPE